MAAGLSRGFTLIELVMVIIMLGTLAVTALPKFTNIKDDAREAAVRATASSFASAIQLTHAGWAVRGQGSALYNLEAMGKKDLDINLYGWPVGTLEDQHGQGHDAPFSGGKSDYISVNCDDDCHLLFEGLLDTSQSVADEKDSASQSDYISAFIGTITPADANGMQHGNCRYQLRHDPKLSFDYNSVTGAVTLGF